jgi:hypothetical protein
MATEVKDHSVNIGETNILNMRVVEKFPPNSPFAKLMGQPGTQTTPSLGRGNLNGSAIALLNGNLEHACDFKFMINVDVFALIGINNPVEAIQRALKNAKLKATNRLKALLKDAMKYIRAGIDAVLEILGFDPSGQISLSFQIGKDLVDKINEAIQWVAEKVEQVMEWVYFAQQIQQLINWINSLPAKLKAMLSACLSNFKKSITAVADQLKSLPDQVINATQAQIQTIANQFTQAAQDIADAAQGSFDAHTADMPDALYQALVDPSAETAAALNDHIVASTPSANTINQSSNDHQSAVNARM